MSNQRRYSIVHVEDDAGHWQTLAGKLENAIGEHLNRKPGIEHRSLAVVLRSEPYKFPSHVELRWIENGIETIIDYFLTTGPGIDDIKDKIEHDRNVTFIVDVMRAKNDNIGMHSTLEVTLNAIKEHVLSWEGQVRLFTAYARTDGVIFPDNAPPLFKKGVETWMLIDFLCARVGVGVG